MGIGEESMDKPSKPSSTSSTQISPTPSYPDWSSSMQAYYAPGVTPPPFYASTVASPAIHPYIWGGQHPLIPPYGTPVPYPAMYPPGAVYAHPSMTTTLSTPQNVMEGKRPDRKDQASAKSSKKMSANTGSKARDNGKASSGSGNDGISQSAESGSEGSSDASDEQTNQQESATNKKGSFNQMLVEGASAQNNSVSVGVISQSAVPGKPVASMSATNLNTGVEFWNASVDATPPTIMGPDATLGEPWRQDEREVKRQKRKLSNRESARRSRLRKQAECEELQKRVESLGNENQTLREELQRVSEECMKLTSENNSIKVNCPFFLHRKS
ncbi:G-box-binding factor 1 isoform X2 [Lotus japonicus]|uniref:G-box-binding factor 1 isoform X2 n=1 Tax=Lotus japonicus TaxID=34305 RepID=UPI0025887C37|nr:G-box-binding factor 1 isoform X2 [Lotus japonicus]